MPSVMAMHEGDAGVDRLAHRVGGERRAGTITIIETVGAGGLHGLGHGVEDGNRLLAFGLRVERLAAAYPGTTPPTTWVP